MDVTAPVTIRAIGADDLERMRRFVQHLSVQTGYQRLLSPRTPTEDELRHWTDVDGEHEFALVATVPAAEGERQVGVARYVVESDGRAEFAIVLADRWQRQGLGRKLLTQLMAAARMRGVRTLYGIALSQNRAMLALAQRLGFRIRRSPESALLMLVEQELGGPG